MEIQIEGLASHAGVAPQLGVSAIAIASLAIADLHRGGWHGLVEKGKTAGTTNVGVIQGGEATNVVTEKVTVRAEARSHDPKFRERIVAEIEKAFTLAVKEVKVWMASGAGAVSPVGSITSRSALPTMPPACWQPKPPSKPWAYRPSAPSATAAWMRIG